MKKRPDVLQALAEARPAQLDPPGPPPLPLALPETTGTERRPRRFRGATLLPVGALAAAAVAAVAVVAIDSDASAPPLPAPEAIGARTAAEMLLTAAERSSRDAPGVGKHLVLRTENGSVLTVGAGAATYEMTVRTSNEVWLSRSGKAPTRVISQPLGMSPPTPADAAAWRAAGSPRRVLVRKPLPSGELGPGTPVDIAGGPRQVSVSSGGDVYALGNTSVSVRDLEKLPTDPAALRDALLQRFDGGGGDLPTDRQQWLLAVASSLIVDIPVSGPVRSAAFRLLATLPGVRSLGVVSDQRGRPGEGFAFDSTSAVTGTIERRFVIDPATGRALGEESRVLRPAGTTARREAGSLFAYSVVLEQRITDEAPPE